MTCDPEGR